MSERYVQRYWMGGAPQIWVVEAADYDALAAQYLKVRDKLLEIAKQCSSCDGKGVVTVREMHPSGDDYDERAEECGDCLDIREALA